MQKVNTAFAWILLNACKPPSSLHLFIYYLQHLWLQSIPVQKRIILHHYFNITHETKKI